MHPLSPPIVLFMAVALWAAWGLGARPRARNLALLALSAGLYLQLAGTVALLTLLTLATWTWAFGRKMAALPGWGAAVGLAGPVGTLAVFKLLDSVLALPFGRLPAPVGLLVPVGLSFYAFNAVAYLLDVRRGRIASAPWVETALLLSFFPHLLAGPILTGRGFMPQLIAPSPAQVALAPGLALIAMGLAKKLLVADPLGAALVDGAFMDPWSRSGIDLWIAVYAYAVQIWADFSGYSDIAIGTALLLGFVFPRNFDRPYWATGPRDFWRRWHITLSRFLRDTIYVPLGGDRHGRGRLALALLVTMGLGGLWHGVGWTFLLWGLLHAAWLLLDRRLPGTGGWPARFVAFHIICAGWVLFRAPDLETAAGVFAGLFRGGPWEGPSGPLVALVLGLAAHALSDGVRARARRAVAATPPWAAALLFGLAVAVISALGPDGPAAFIYFRF